MELHLAPTMSVGVLGLTSLGLSTQRDKWFTPRNSYSSDISLISADPQTLATPNISFMTSFTMYFQTCKYMHLGQCNHVDFLSDRYLLKVFKIEGLPAVMINPNAYLFTKKYSDVSMSRTNKIFNVNDYANFFAPEAVSLYDVDDKVIDVVGLWQSMIMGGGSKYYLRDTGFETLPECFHSYFGPRSYGMFVNNADVLTSVTSPACLVTPALINPSSVYVNGRFRTYEPGSKVLLAVRVDGEKSIVEVSSWVIDVLRGFISLLYAVLQSPDIKYFKLKRWLMPTINISAQSVNNMDLAFLLPITHILVHWSGIEYILKDELTTTLGNILRYGDQNPLDDIGLLHLFETSRWLTSFVVPHECGDTFHCKEYYYRRVFMPKLTVTSYVWRNTGAWEMFDKANIRNNDIEFVTEAPEMPEVNTVTVCSHVTEAVYEVVMDISNGLRDDGMGDGPDRVFMWWVKNEHLPAKIICAECINKDKKDVVMYSRRFLWH